jgi:hypothetical protein
MLHRGLVLAEEIPVRIMLIIAKVQALGRLASSYLQEL